MNLPLARYQVTLSLLTPTTRHMTYEAPSLEDLCGAAVIRATHGGPATGHRSAERQRLKTQGRRPSRAGAQLSSFPFPLLA